MGSLASVVVLPLDWWTNSGPPNRRGEQSWELEMAIRQTLVVPFTRWAEADRDGPFTPPEADREWSPCTS